MSYESEELIREVQVQRIKAAMSQRALGVRSGLTQAHISQIENGRLEPGLSSFIHLARALDLEIVLVPKKLLPAVEGVLRAASSQIIPEDGQSALFAKGERILAKQKKRQGSSAVLDRIAEYFRFLKQVRLSRTDLAFLEDSIEILRHLSDDPQSNSQVENIAGALQGLRDRIAHPSEAPRPAYALDEDDDA